MWQAILDLVILFIVGRAALFLVNQLDPRFNFSWVEVGIYSFSLGYAVLTIIDVVLAQYGLLTPLIDTLVFAILPVLAVYYWIRKKRQKKPQDTQSLIASDRPNQERSISKRISFSSIRFSYIVLFLIFAAGLILRLETQLAVPWLGDQDPYYHLSLIDSVVAQGTLPYRTHWGFYSYPPSFHVVLATLISTTQVDRFALMKVVPEFLGFLSVPAVYAIIKRKYSEWAGIASAGFLAICSYHIYRTNIGIPEPITLLAMLMFFHAMLTQEGTKKYLLAGLFASMVFLTNTVGILYFLPSVVAITVASMVLKRWKEALGFLTATSLGVVFSGVFWLPTFDHLGLSGIFEGLGPSYPYGGVFSFTSHTYFSNIGWGACLLALAGLYVCLRDFKKTLIFSVPTIFFLFLVEAANNGILFFDTSLVARGLLFLGTWVSLLAGVGFWLLMQKTRKKIAVTALLVMIVLTAVSFPFFSGRRYPSNWGYDDSDFVYRSYLENYADILGNKNYTVYASDIAFNYGAFNNVILPKEAPQIGEALLKNDSSTSVKLVNEYNIKYLIFRNGTTQAEFLLQSNLTYTYYEDWHTIVLATK